MSFKLRDILEVIVMTLKLFGDCEKGFTFNINLILCSKAGYIEYQEKSQAMGDFYGW